MTSMFVICKFKPGTLSISKNENFDKTKKVLVGTIPAIFFLPCWHQTRSCELYRLHDENGVIESLV